MGEGGPVVNLSQRLEQSQQALRELCGETPDWVVVLGSGFSSLVDSFDRINEISFESIPHFRSPTVQGHSGRLIISNVEEKRVAFLQGRLHTYEGHSMEEVVFAVRALALAGAKRFILTNASGSLHLEWPPPSLVLIRDHINLMGSNPLVGSNLEFLGPRFPDLSHVYDLKLQERFRSAARQEGIELREGVYVGITGPCYETPSEVKMYQRFGGDIVGMSTIPEAIALRHMGKEVAAVSCAANLAAGTGVAISHEEVLISVKKAAEDLSKLLGKVVRD
jgi:purine-nucleoside phosphorylase